VQCPPVDGPDFGQFRKRPAVPACAGA
jgi:hypothetical protein